MSSDHAWAPLLPKVADPPIDVIYLDLDRPECAPDVEQTSLVLVRHGGFPRASLVVEAGLGRGALLEAAQEAVDSLRSPSDRVESNRVPVTDADLTDAGLTDAGLTEAEVLDLTAGPGEVTVVITAIHDSPQLHQAIDWICAQSLKPAEVIVVDNRPSTSGLREILASRTRPGVRYVAERRRGTSNARNAGLREVKTPLVAFADDDVRPDPDWLMHLVSGFENASVTCVMGLIMPAELRTDAQVWMEQFGGFSKGFERVHIDAHHPEWAGPLHPYRVGIYGSGANAAFRTESLRRIGGFDEDLGAGRPTRGGEDLDIFLRLVLAGDGIVYEPGALVWHRHVPEIEQFRMRVLGYGMGLSAVFTKHLMATRSERVAILRRMHHAAHHMWSGKSTKNASKGGSYPRWYSMLELLGVVVGPPVYAWTRWRSRGDGANRRVVRTSRPDAT